MGEEQSEGLGTNIFSSSGKAFGSAKSSILGHIFRRKGGGKKANKYAGLALSKNFAILTILPERQAPYGQSVPQASGAPPFLSARRLACNGFIVPPPPTASPGRGKLGSSAALRAPRFSRRTPGSWLTECLPQGPLTSDARGGWLRRHCAPNMAAADQAASHTQRGGRQSGRAGASKKGAPPAPYSPCHRRCLLPADAESPRPPHPDSYPLHAYLKGKGKGKGEVPLS